MNSPTWTTWFAQVAMPAKLLILTHLILSRFDKVEIDLYYLLASANFLFVVFQNRLSDIFMKMLSFSFAGADDLSKWTEKSKNGNGEPNWPLFQRAYLAMGYLTLMAIVPATIFSFATGWWALGCLTDFSYERVWLWGALTIGVINPALGIYFQRPGVALRATGGITVQNRLLVFSSLLSIVVCALVLILGGRIFSLILTQFLFNWVQRFLLISRLPSEVKSYALKFRWDPEIFLWCKEPLLKGCITVFAGMGVHRSLGIFLVSTGIPGFAAPFLFAQSLFASGEKIAYGPLQSQMPRYSKMLAQGDRNEILIDSIWRILFIFITLFSMTVVLAILGPFFFEFIDANISFLPIGIFILLGSLRAIYGLQQGFLRVQNLTNNILVVNRYLLALPIALVFFAVGLWQKNYLWFALGAYLPQMLVLNTFTYRKFMDLGDLSFWQVSSLARIRVWNTKFTWLRKS